MYPRAHLFHPHVPRSISIVKRIERICVAALRGIVRRLERKPARVVMVAKASRTIVRVHIGEAPLEGVRYPVKKHCARMRIRAVLLMYPSVAVRQKKVFICK